MRALESLFELGRMNPHDFVLLESQSVLETDERAERLETDEERAENDNERAEWKWSLVELWRIKAHDFVVLGLGKLEFTPNLSL